jgi:hypothetical protein
MHPHRSAGSFKIDEGFAKRGHAAVSPAPPPGFQQIRTHRKDNLF